MKYETPKMDILFCDMDDIIRTSPTTDGKPGGGNSYQDPDWT